MPKTVTKKLGAKKIATTEVEETIAPEITVPEVKVEEPKKEVFVEKMPIIGELGLEKVLTIKSKILNGRECNEVYCVSGQTYLLNSHDLEKQYKPNK